MDASSLNLSIGELTLHLGLSSTLIKPLRPIVPSLALAASMGPCPASLLVMADGCTEGQRANRLITSHSVAA